MLGLTFKWGALVGWAAINGSLALAPLVLYAGSVLWTIGYDTIYAHQDKEDDLMVGLKSTALRFGEQTQRWLVGFYGGALMLWGYAGLLAGAQIGFFLALAAGGGSARLAGGDARYVRPGATASPASSPTSWWAGRFFSASWPTWRSGACPAPFEARHCLDAHRRGKKYPCNACGSCRQRRMDPVNS